MPENALNPAEIAAERALVRMYDCIDKRKNFLLEAGAGAGKTHSLVKALNYLIQAQGERLVRQQQQIACITFTNVATTEIESRTDRHPAIYSSTIHAFCWSLIKNFQPYLRKELLSVNGWAERLKEAAVDEVGTRRIGYDELGHRGIDEKSISLHHDDVLSITVKILGQKKFRALLLSKYPVVFIDEYQDTDANVIEAFKSHFLTTKEGPLLGFFGDHWQKIYGNGCGKIEHPELEMIGKESNFRSVTVIVEVLNRMRPTLPQQVVDPQAIGSAAVYHTNDWIGTRRNGQHWDGDLPQQTAQAYLEALKSRLLSEGWNFSPEVTKILMLTHKGLATIQGYSNLAGVFTHNESFIKKENRHIAFFVETIEPVCLAYQKRHFGEMFAAMGGRIPTIRSHSEKLVWENDMVALMNLRSGGKIGEVIEQLKRTNKPRLPDAVLRKELELDQPPQTDAPQSKSIEQLRALKEVAYKEVIALTQFINGHTPFETKHGVKGAQFENVLVVFGRGWNQYNFNQFLEWAGSAKVPASKMDTFERNRNLFYVCCSRAQKRLALLFTQKLSNTALNTLHVWFGQNAIHSLGNI